MKNTEKTYYTVDEVAEIIGCKKEKAYKEVQRLNDVLRKKGYITMSGKINSIWFRKYYPLTENDVTRNEIIEPSINTVSDTKEG